MKPIAVARRMGAPGFAALLLFGWVAWTRCIVEPGLADDIAVLRGQAREARAHQSVPAASVPAGERLLSEFRARLPDDLASNETLAAVLKQAKTEGLVADTARFETAVTRLPGVVRHRADLPLKGRYVALRAWLSLALRDNAGLTLDALEIQRHDADTNDVDAHVTLSLWARSGALSEASRAEGDHGR